MPSDSDKPIRSINDNPAGKVVDERPAVTRWKWNSDDDTAVQLKKLSNDDLAIAQTGVGPSPLSVKGDTDAAPQIGGKSHPLKKAPTRDAGGGFNPYDNTDPSKRR